jgi:hypothetical protein
MRNYRDVVPSAPDYQPMEYWSADSGQSAAEYLATLGNDGTPDAEIIDLMTSGESAV